MLRRALTGGLVAALAFSLTGCIEKESDRQVVGSHPDASSHAAAGEGVVLEQGSTSGCLLPGSYLVYEPLEVTEEVTFDAPEAAGAGAQVSTAWIAPKPEGQEAPLSGISTYSEEAPLPLHSREVTNWDARKELTDDSVEPGDYYLFVLFRGDRDGDELEQIDVSWTHEGRQAQGTIQERHTFDAGCKQDTRPVGLRIQEGFRYDGCVGDSGPVLLQFPFVARSSTTVDEVNVYPSTIRTRRTWVAPTSAGAADLVASVRWPDGFGPQAQARYGWAGRLPAKGAEIAAGRYHVLALVDLPVGATVEGLDIGWRSGSEGSVLDLPTRVTAGACD